MEYFMIHPLRFVQLFLLCSIVLGNGKAHCSDSIISVVTWNLQWFPGKDAVEQILDHIARTEKDSGILNPPILVCGDFNTDSVNPNVPSERTFKMLNSKGFFWTFEGIPKENRITCPGKRRYPPASFDHIFCRGLGRLVAAPLSLYKGSDHFPVRVQFKDG